MRAVSVTNRGDRDNNEDSLRYVHSGDVWCFVVCDGLGGHNYGEIASKIAADAICEAFEKNPAVSDEAVRQYLETASEILSDERRSNPDRSDMSTTAVVLVTNGKKAVWAHIGDSRLYYIEQGEISVVTDDHSVAFMQFQTGAITYDDIRRSPNQNMLLRCLGDAYRFMPDISAVTDVGRGDCFLLCTDGFWEFVTEDDMQETLSRAASPKEWLTAMLAVLHENEVTGNDNYSAIAVMI